MPSVFARLIGYSCVLFLAMTNTSVASQDTHSPASLPRAQASGARLAAASLDPGPEKLGCAARLDPQLVDAAAQAVRIAPITSQIWPGFHIPARAILIYRPEGGAILVSRARGSSPFVAVARDRLPLPLRGQTYTTCVPLPGLNGNFNTDYRIGTIRAVAVKLEPTTYETLEVLFHESFHKFQDTAFSRTIGASSTALAVEKRLDPEIVSRPEFVASMEVERRILAQAVKLGDARAVPLLRQYLAVRAERRAGLPTDVRDAELNIERKEGSAALVGSEIASRAVGRDPRLPSAQLLMFLAEPPESLPSGLSGYGRFRARAFGSGAAIAWILTRLRKPWRIELEHGASFEALLVKAVGHNKTIESADDVKARFGYAELLKDAQEWHKQYGKEASREDFYRTGPVRLIVEFAKEGEKSPEFKGQGTGLTSQPEDNVVIFMGAQAFAVDYGPVAIRAERPYMLDFTGAPKVYRVEITLEGFPRIDGMKPGGQIVEWSGGGTIEGKGIRVTIGGRAAIRIAGNTLTVDVGQ